MTEEVTLALNAKAAAIVQDFEIPLYGGGSEQAVQQLMGQLHRQPAGARLCELGRIRGGLVSAWSRTRAAVSSDDPSAPCA
jgi:hypothetical protein